MRRNLFEVDGPIKRRKQLLVQRRAIASHFAVNVAQVTEEHFDEYAALYPCDQEVLTIIADTKAARQAAEQESKLQMLREMACGQLGIKYEGRLIYGAQAAADAIGLSVGALRKFVEPSSYARNPRYRCAADVGLYDPIDLLEALRHPKIQELKAKLEQRRLAAEKATHTRCDRMIERIQSAELCIIRGKTDAKIRQLAVDTYGGNYRGDPGEFIWSNRTARNCIRHNLTNYERLWQEINRGYTGEEAYRILRERIDALVDEAYPQFADDFEEA